MIGLLAASTVPPYLELRNRRRPTQVYVLHMGLFAAMLVAGWADIASGPPSSPPTWGILLVLAAGLIRCGTVPAHCWLTDWFANASFGNALLFVVPLTGVYVAVRLLLPIGANWVFQLIGIVSLTTAVYAAVMATVQGEAPRLFAYVFMSHASLVMVGLEMHTEIALTGSLCVWFSVIVLFTGARHASTVSLGITSRERFAVLTLAALILGGGIFPQPGVTSRQRATESILKDRESRQKGAEPAGHLSRRRLVQGRQSASAITQLAVEAGTISGSGGSRGIGSQGREATSSYLCARFS